MNRQLLIPTDITQNIKSFKQSKKHKRDGLNEEEINLLVEKLNNIQSNPRSIRLKAILSLLILQGLRECEITRLNVADIDLVNSTAFICGKGQDDKELIYLHPEATKALKNT